MRSGRPMLLAFYLANAVKIHPTSTDRVDEVLRKNVGRMLTPPASPERLDELGDFEELVFDIEGRGWDDAAVDLVLPGLGWVSVTGCGPCRIGVAMPRPVRALVREPLISLERRASKKSYVKYSGGALRDGRGNTKRRRR